MQNTRMISLIALAAMVLSACDPGPDESAATSDDAPEVTLPLEPPFPTAGEIKRGDVNRVEVYPYGLVQHIATAKTHNTIIEWAEIDPEEVIIEAIVPRSDEEDQPLRGVPILIKDNIETRDMPTTAGSLALIDNDTGRDSPLVARLRRAGAIIVGKTNLSEWANFRSTDSISGWSSVGGLTSNAHDPARTACGSSSGSGAAVALGIAPIAIGTETNGSIMCPAAMNGIYGLKPTVGLIPRTHIVPISHSQDTAGPMALSVEDLALALTVMAGSHPTDPASSEADEHKMDYTSVLGQSLEGMRIGVLVDAKGSFEPVAEIFDAALPAFEEAGATLVELESPEVPDGFWGASFLVLQYEFKDGLNAYLADAAPAVTTRTLSDVIAHNEANAERALALFGQDILEMSDARGPLTDQEYLDALELIQTTTRQNGIDKLLTENDVDVLIAPSRPPAFLIDRVYGDQYPGGGVGADWMAAIAGYPNLTVPIGQHRGLPIGLSIMGAKWDEATVIKVADGFDRALGLTQESRAEAIAKGLADAKAAEMSLAATNAEAP